MGFYQITQYDKQLKLYKPAHDKTYKKDLCGQQRLRSACTSTQYVKGSRLSLFEKPEAVEGTCGQRRFWPDCADAQVDLCLRLSHVSL